MFPTLTFFGTDTIPTVEISSMENRPRGCWCYIHRRILQVQYASGVKNLVDKNLRLRLLGFKNLHVSICAELEEEIIIRNWEVHGGRQIRICWNAVHP